MALLRTGSRGTAVRTLQSALNAKLRPSPGLSVDGVFGPRTKSAVLAFQRQAGIGVDGVVGPQTQAALASAGSPGGGNPGGTPATPVTPPAGTGAEYFPFKSMSNWSYKTSYRAFGSNRSNGTRAHAACDIYFPQGTHIHAITDGVVIEGPYAFYAGTYAIEIDHGSFTARYGEVQQNAQVAKGDQVTAGQHIAQVGHLIGINVPSDMLHLELYSGAGSGPLSVSGAGGKVHTNGLPFRRRRDLLNPTSYLDRWSSNLPT
ncbi:MAG: peptidoglycan-binding protein [Mariniblastus sp.]